MAQMFILSQKHTALALGEIKALLDKNADIKLYDYIAITDSNKQLSKRLVYTQFFYKFLFYCKESELRDKMNSFDWEKYYKYSFCIRKFGSSKMSEKDLADIVWNRINNPTVDLNSPKTSFHFYFTKKGVFAGIFTGERRTDYKQRLPALRPFSSASTMTPRISACLINLSGITQGMVYDPMCGTGAILLEAAAMGFRIAGSDTDEAALKSCRENLAHFGFKGDIFVQDVTKIKKRYPYVITDLPYGKHTSMKGDIRDFYLAFLKNLRKILKTRAVIVFPSFIRYKSLIKKSKLTLKEDYSYYMHKSLSRVICVIEP